MKTEIWSTIKGIAIVLLFSGLALSTFYIYSSYNYEKWEKEYTSRQEDYDREFALTQLGALEGRVQEIRRMYESYMERLKMKEEAKENSGEEGEKEDNSSEEDSEEEVFKEPETVEIYYLRHELYTVVNYKPGTANQYLEDMDLSTVVSRSMTIDEACEALISKIGQKIQNIRFINDEIN